jgi:hypothetical protein
MMDYISQHKLVSLLIVVILIAAAWWGFTQTSGPAPVLSTDTLGNATDTQDAQIVSTLLQLQAVSLSGAILTDPGFLALQDFTTQVVTEPLGRPNPFAPVNGSASTATSTQALNPNLFAPAKH